MSGGQWKVFATYALAAVAVGAIRASVSAPSPAEAASTVPAAVEAVLVKDIWPGPQGSTEFLRERGLAVGGRLFLRANDGARGLELWKSDGTEAGTKLVKDIAAGARSSAPYPETTLNGMVFFSASVEDDPEMNGREPWKSKGTRRSTKLIRDIIPGPVGSHPGLGTRVNDRIFFRADDGVNGTELWKSDGTRAGTVLVKDIDPGSNWSYPTMLRTVGDSLFLFADVDALGKELWKSDGTEAGTVLVKDIYPGPGDGPWNLTDMIVNGGTVFFGARDASHGVELWKSDGTEAGTVLVKDINPTGSGLPNGMWPWPGGAVLNGILYFSADDGVNGFGLWRSDGTEAGTFLVKAVPSSRMTRVGNAVFFVGRDPQLSFELWKTDGTAAGTVLVKDINPGPESSLLRNLTAVGNRLFFVADDGVSGFELWTSDGTEAGTFRVKDIYPGPQDSSPEALINVAGTLFFTADDGTNGRELWKVETQ